MNQAKTVFLLVLLTGLLLGLGWAFGGTTGVIIAFGFSLAMNAWTYWFSDRLALAMSGAHQVSEQDEPDLHRVVQEVADMARLPKPKVYVIQNDSPNAFATGRNPKHAVICVTTGLLEKLNRAELEGVIAHEMSHIKNYDVLVQTLTVVMVGIVALMSDWMLRTFMWGGGGRRRSRERSGGGGAAAIFIVLGLVLAVLSPLIYRLIQFAVSRKREFLADASSAMLTRYPPGLASALRKISADTEPLEAANKATAHLYIVNPLKNVKGMVNKLFSTHPPIEERIAALEKM